MFLPPTGVLNASEIKHGNLTERVLVVIMASGQMNVEHGFRLLCCNLGIAGKRKKKGDYEEIGN